MVYRRSNNVNVYEMALRVACELCLYNWDTPNRSTAISILRMRISHIGSPCVLPICIISVSAMARAQRGFANEHRPTSIKRSLSAYCVQLPAYTRWLLAKLDRFGSVSLNNL